MRNQGLCWKVHICRWVGFFSLLNRTSVASPQVGSSLLRCCERCLEKSVQSDHPQKPYYFWRGCKLFKYYRYDKFLFMARSFEWRCFNAETSFTRSWPGGSPTDRSCSITMARGAARPITVVRRAAREPCCALSQHC